MNTMLAVLLILLSLVTTWHHLLFLQVLMGFEMLTHLHVSSPESNCYFVFYQLKCYRCIVKQMWNKHPIKKWRDKTGKCICFRKMLLLLQKHHERKLNAFKCCALNCFLNEPVGSSNISSEDNNLQRIHVWKKCSSACQSLWAVGFHQCSSMSLKMSQNTVLSFSQEMVANWETKIALLSL